MSHDSSKSGKIRGWINKQWVNRMPRILRLPLEDAFQPESLEERLLPNEEVQLVVHMAWYRDLVGIIMFGYGYFVFGLTIVATAVSLVASFLYQYSLYYALAPLGIYLLALLTAFYEWLEFRQWRLVRTNARFIISKPIHNSWPYVDNIDLKNVPNVIDTNLTNHPVWRIFQLWTGARDLAISLSGYKFVSGTTVVADPITFPDVMPQDIQKLRLLVFPVPKPPSPQKVVFPEPQAVIFPDPQEVLLQRPRRSNMPLALPEPEETPPPSEKT